MSLQNTHYGAERIGRMLEGCGSIYFIGIGGISMSALAMLSHLDGCRVGGSDRAENDLTERLRASGITVYPEHLAVHVAGYDAVVYTVAIGADNPEYLAAKEAGKPLISRADYLGYLMMRFRHRIGFSGMHGKSTATAMCSHIFLESADPTVLCGAELPELDGSTYRVGSAREHLIFEACEYMDSFLDFSPTVAVILNIGMDHVDYFHSIAQIRESFLRFAERTGRGGMVLLNADDSETVLAMERFAGRKVTFGVEKPADFSVCGIRMEHGLFSFDFRAGEKTLCRISLRVPGKHNLYNALAAATAAYLHGIPPEKISASLSSFTGARRRMEYKGKLKGAAVYDDYANHPDEIRATLAGAKQLGFRRVLCAYQPHTYSRTAGLLREFSEAFPDADRVFLVDIYAAREQNVYGVNSALLAEKIGEKARYCGSFEATAAAISEEAAEGDLVLIMGAGDVFHVFGLLGLGESENESNTVQ